MQSWASETDKTFLAAKKFSEIVKIATDGKLVIDVLPTGIKAPKGKEFEGVISGMVDLAQAPPGWTTDYLRGADFFSNWVNGLTPNQLEMWMKYEGNALARKLYDPIGVHFIGILTLSPPEVWAHSTKPLNSVKDIQGLPMRVGGGDMLAIFQKMGGSPVMLPGSEIYKAAQEGTIEAFEYINPSVNITKKFYEVSKYMYLDPSRSPCDAQVLWMNKNTWDKLPRAYQEIIHMANDQIAREFYVESFKQDADAVEEFKKQGTVVSKLPEDIVALLNEKALEYFDEEAKKNENFKLLYQRSLEWKKICQKYDIK